MATCLINQNTFSNSSFSRLASIRMLLLFVIFPVFYLILSMPYAIASVPDTLIPGNAWNGTWKRKCLAVVLYEVKNDVNAAETLKRLSDDEHLLNVPGNATPCTAFLTAFPGNFNACYNSLQTIVRAIPGTINQHGTGEVTLAKICRRLNGSMLNADMNAFSSLREQKNLLQADIDNASQLIQYFGLTHAAVEDAASHVDEL